MTNRCRLENFANNKASSPPQSRLGKMIGFLLLRQSSRSVLNPRRVMSKKSRERLPREKQRKSCGNFPGIR